MTASGQIASIDPGKDGNIGVALWEPNGVLVMKELMRFDGLVLWLEKSGLRRVVVEDFVLDHRAGRQVGSPMAASQVLGAVKSYALRTDTPITIQKNTVLKPTAMHFGVPIPANGHFKDDVSAMLHGAHYFESIGMSARDIQIS